MFERRLALVGALLIFTGSAVADEGMWTFDNPPAPQLREKFGFAPTPEWLDQLRLASVRFNDGGSGAFVSADGLMITNHHVGLACIQNVSTPEHDYVKDGFYAPTRDQEAACPGYEVNVLMKIEDVTGRVLGAVKPAMSDKEAGDARQAAVAALENECSAQDGPALRRGEALPGRRVPPLPLQEVHRRAPRLRPRAGHRLLRGRPRQLHLPAARPRHLPLPRLRERPAREAGLVPEVEQSRR